MIMTIKELPDSASFVADNGKYYTKIKPVLRQEGVWVCADRDGRHILFDEKVEVKLVGGENEI